MTMAFFLDTIIDIPLHLILRNPCRSIRVQVLRHVHYFISAFLILIKCEGLHLVDSFGQVVIDFIRDY